MFYGLWISTPVIRTVDTIVAKHKHFTKDTKVPTRRSTRTHVGRKKTDSTRMHGQQ